MTEKAQRIPQDIRHTELPGDHLNGLSHHEDIPRLEGIRWIVFDVVNGAHILDRLF